MTEVESTSTYIGGSGAQPVLASFSFGATSVAADRDTSEVSSHKRESKGVVAVERVMAAHRRNSSGTFEKKLAFQTAKKLTNVLVQHLNPERDQGFIDALLKGFEEVGYDAVTKHFREILEKQHFGTQYILKFMPEMDAKISGVFDTVLQMAEGGCSDATQLFAVQALPSICAPGQVDQVMNFLAKGLDKPRPIINFIFESRNEKLRDAYTLSLAAMGTASFPLIREYLQDDRKKRRALSILEKMGPAAAEFIPEVNSLLSDKVFSKYFSQHIVITLGKLGAKELLMDLFEKASLQQRLPIIEALGELGTDALPFADKLVPSATQKIPSRNSDKRTQMIKERISALLTLGKIGYTEVEDLFVQNATDINLPEKIRESALDALGYLKEISFRSHWLLDNVEEGCPPSIRQKCAALIRRTDTGVIRVAIQTGASLDALRIPLGDRGDVRS